MVAAAVPQVAGLVVFNTSRLAYMGPSSGWKIDGFLYRNTGNGHMGILLLAVGNSSEETCVQYWDMSCDQTWIYKTTWHGHWGYAPEKRKEREIGPEEYGPNWIDKYVVTLEEYGNQMKEGFSRFVYFDYLGREDRARYKKHTFGLTRWDFFVVVDPAGHRIELTPLNDVNEPMLYGSERYYRVLAKYWPSVRSRL